MAKILVPVDGSAASKSAAAKAVEIAKKNNDDIVFLSVVDFKGKYAYMGYMGDGVDPAYLSNESNIQIAKMLLENQKQMLEDFVTSVKPEGISFQNQVVEGVPYEEILKYATENAVDLIVMGRRGFSKVRRFFVGSVTQRVIADAPCPVLILHEEQE